MHMQTVVDGVVSLGSAGEGGGGGGSFVPQVRFDQDRLTSCILVVFLSGGCCRASPSQGLRI